MNKLFYWYFLCVTVPVFAQPVVRGTVSHASCYGLADGSIQLDIAGKAPFLVRWEDGSAFENRKGIQPGIYKATVTDANGSSSHSTFEVKAETDLIIRTEINNRHLSVSITGGVQPYTWYLSDLNRNRQIEGIHPETEGFDNLAPSRYALIVRDGKGCTAIKTVEIK